MKLFKFIFIFFILFSFLVKANEDTVDLHKNKTFDQLVLESESNDNENLNNDQADVELNKENSLENVTSSDLQNDTEESNIDDNNLVNSNDPTNNISETVTVLKSDNIFDFDGNIIESYLQNIQDIKSKTLNREFIKILSNLELEDKININNKIYFIIKKLYNIGEIGKAYKLIKSIDINSISNQESLNFFYLIELNYLFSTFNLSEVCELKSSLLDESVVLSKFLLEKTDIFCLILEEKFAEAKLLNSLLLDSEKETDKNFQKLFNFMTFDDKYNQTFLSLTQIKSKELIFLYSAMLRINELPLDSDFIDIDPLNLSIPVILSNSSKMDVRIKAANKSFYNEVLSIDSLSALYQSVDFNSKDFNKPKKTILSLNNNKELIMAFYYQLANIQIFPDQRLNVILDYWQFAKNSGLEKIAYAITKNIIETFTPTSENTKYGIEIALAHISNKNYLEASKWINVIENSNAVKDQVDYLKFLITLHETDELGTIINYLENNNYKIDSKNNQKTLETMEILISFLNVKRSSDPLFSYYNITDNRLMPSYFLIQHIKKNMQTQKDLSLFFLSLVSMNNKNWDELHPEHLILILNAFNSYNQGSLIKPIILEILNDLEIIQ